MNLREMRYIVALADTGTLTRAGERLYVSRQIMGKTISQVEQRLGARLFEREGRSVVPTDYGNLLVHDARQIVDAVEAFNETYEPASAEDEEPEMAAV